jgi:hypothetical protein
MVTRTLLFGLLVLMLQTPAWGQTVSGVRAFGGGVGPLFNLVGPGNLYLDTQGTQGYMYTFQTFESYNFRNPTTGQAWSGAVMTLGPQLSIGLIQGANQIGSPLVLIGPPGQPGAPMVSGFSLTGLSGPGQGGATGPGVIFSPVPSIPVVGSNPAGPSVQPVIFPSSLLLNSPPPTSYGAPHEIESTLLDIP